MEITSCPNWLVYLSPVYSLTLIPNRALWGSWAHKPFCIFHFLPSFPCTPCSNHTQIMPHDLNVPYFLFFTSVSFNCSSFFLECPSPYCPTFRPLLTPNPCPFLPDSPWYKSPQFPSHSHSPKTNEWETRLEMWQWFSGLLILNSGFEWNLRL